MHTIYTKKQNLTNKAKTIKRMSRNEFRVKATMAIASKKIYNRKAKYGCRMDE